MLVAIIVLCTIAVGTVLTRAQQRAAREQEIEQLQLRLLHY